MRFTAAFGPGFYGPVKPHESRYHPWVGKQVELTRKNGTSFTVTVNGFSVDKDYDTVYMYFDVVASEPDHTSVRQLTIMVNQKEKT